MAKLLVQYTCILYTLSVLHGQRARIRLAAYVEYSTTILPAAALGPNAYGSSRNKAAPAIDSSSRDVSHSTLKRIYFAYCSSVHRHTAVHLVQVQTYDFGRTLTGRRIVSLELDATPLNS